MLLATRFDVTFTHDHLQPLLQTADKCFDQAGVELGAWLVRLEGGEHWEPVDYGLVPGRPIRVVEQSEKTGIG